MLRRILCFTARLCLVGVWVLFNVVVLLSPCLCEIIDPPPLYITVPALLGCVLGYVCCAAMCIVDAI